MTRIEPLVWPATLRRKSVDDDVDPPFRQPATKRATTFVPRNGAPSQFALRLRSLLSLNSLLVIMALCGVISMILLRDALADISEKPATAAQQNFVRRPASPQKNSTTTMSAAEALRRAAKLAPVGDTPPPQRRDLKPNSTKEHVPVQATMNHSQSATVATVVAPTTTRGVSFDYSVSREQGLILCLYDGAMAMGFSLIQELRCLGNTELIQVYHCFDDELSPMSKQSLLDLDNRLEIVDVCSDLVARGAMPIDLAKKFKNWWIKPLAVHHTDLIHVILLDADDFLMKDPALLRQSQSYRETGTLFFYDRVLRCQLYLNKRVPGRPSRPYLKHILETFDYSAFKIASNTSRPSQRVRDSLIYQGKTCHEQDSSMVLIDKSLAGQALDVLWWLITRERLRFEFSWGDKESFWLAYELAQQPYAFSPWGVSVVSSSSNGDMKDHPDTLCGSIAQYTPSQDTEPELFYVNGKALLEPIPQGQETRKFTANLLHNANPSHVTPRHHRTEVGRPPKGSAFPSECLVSQGSVLLPADFQLKLLRRRIYYEAVVLGITSTRLRLCDIQ